MTITRPLTWLEPHRTHKLTHISESETWATMECQTQLILLSAPVLRAAVWNSTIPQPLPIHSDSFMTTSVTVSHNENDYKCTKVTLATKTVACQLSLTQELSLNYRLEKTLVWTLDRSKTFQMTTNFWPDLTNQIRIWFNISKQKRTSNFSNWTMKSNLQVCNVNLHIFSSHLQLVICNILLELPL